MPRNNLTQKRGEGKTRSKKKSQARTRDVKVDRKSLSPQRKSQKVAKTKSKQLGGKSKSSKKLQSTSRENKNKSSSKGSERKNQKKSFASSETTNPPLGFDYREAIGNEFGCGKKLTRSDLENAHSTNPQLRAYATGLFSSVNIPNYGFHLSQTTSTQGVPDLFKNYLAWTIRNFRLNGRSALRLRGFDLTSSNFFSTPSELKKIKADVTTLIPRSYWASSDREGLNRVRFDTNTILSGVMDTFVRDIDFYYGGCSWQSINACGWSQIPTEFWPSGISPDTTLAEVFANPLFAIYLENYDVDDRALRSVPKLDLFENLNYTLREVLTLPYPAADIGVTGSWTCFLWFSIQQVLTAVLNATTRTMKYRFSIGFLMGAGSWMILRWCATAIHSLNLPGVDPLNFMSVQNNLESLMLMICTLYTENNRGCFYFPSCPTTGSTTSNNCSTTDASEECCDDGLGNEGCNPTCEPKIARENPLHPLDPNCVNQNLMSDIGDIPCVCRRCVPSTSTESDCSSTCTEEEECCVACPPTEAPPCIPTLVDLTNDFITQNYVTEDNNLNLFSSNKPLNNLETKTFQGEEKKKKSLAPSSSGGFLSGYSRTSPFTSCDAICQKVRQLLGDSVDLWLIREYYYIFSSIEPTNLLEHSSPWGINFASFMESLTDSTINLLSLTLEQQNIPINESQTEISFTAFNILQEMIISQLQPATFISSTSEDLGLRFDFNAMVYGTSRLAHNDTTAFYLNMRLEALDACGWNRAPNRFWSVDPNITLGDVLENPATQIYQHPYLIDSRGFVGFPGLLNFQVSAEAKALTLREILVAPNPLAGGLYLNFVWSFIQQALTAFLNATSGCLFYRFPVSWLFSAGSYALLKICSEMVYSLNLDSMISPPPNIDTPTLAASVRRLIILYLSLYRANLNGTWTEPRNPRPHKHRRSSSSKKKRSRKHKHKHCTQPTESCDDCSTTTPTFIIPNEIELVDAFRVFMTSV